MAFHDNDTASIHATRMGNAAVGGTEAPVLDTSLSDGGTPQIIGDEDRAIDELAAKPKASGSTQKGTHHRRTVDMSKVLACDGSSSDEGDAAVTPYDMQGKLNATESMHFKDLSSHSGVASMMLTNSFLETVRSVESSIAVTGGCGHPQNGRGSQY